MSLQGGVNGRGEVSEGNNGWELQELGYQGGELNGSPHLVGRG